MAAATWGRGFSREFRLDKAADFQPVFEKPVKSADAYLTVLARVNRHAHARLGLAISKKNVRKACDRNRIKRLIRESFRLQCSSLGNIDIVVLARVAAGQAERKILRASLEKHWDILRRRCV